MMNLEIFCGIFGFDKITYRDKQTISHDEKKYRSNAEVGSHYSLSASHVSRYLRIQYLIGEFKQWLDDGKLGFVQAVELSFLPETEQRMVGECAERNNLSIDGKKPNTLRAFYKSGELNGENIYKILSGNLKPKPDKKAPIMVKPDVYEKYFTEGESPEEMQATIERALELWFSDPIG
jgi:ParB family chromosome partitioning protein